MRISTRPFLDSLILALCGACVCSTPASASAEAHFISPQQDVTELIGQMRARLQLMEFVAAWKFQHDLPVTDAAREGKVLDATVQQARELGIDAVGARSLFSLQIALARKIQESCMSRWRSGAPVDVKIRDLDSDLRPALDRIGAQLLRSIYLSLPELQQPDFSSRYAGQRQALLLPGLDAADADAMLLALSNLRRAPAPTLSRITRSKVLRIGTTGDYAPFSLETNGALQGADVDAMADLARSLDAEPHFVRTSWSTLMQDYRDGRFDVAMGGISVTPERSAEGRFSQAYQRGGKTPIVRCGTEVHFDTLGEIDRPQTRVLVNPGGTNEQFARRELGHAQIVLHPDNRTIFAELSAGHGDVMVTDDVEVELQTRHNPGKLCRATPATFTSSDKAILMPRDDAWGATIDRWLASRMESGAMRSWLEEAFAR